MAGRQALGIVLQGWVLAGFGVDTGKAPSAVKELPRSFLRDWVAAVHGVGIPGQKGPGQAEACPHTAAIALRCRRKRLQSGMWTVAPFAHRVPTPGHGIDRDFR